MRQTHARVKWTAVFGAAVLLLLGMSNGLAYGTPTPASLTFDPASPFNFGDVLVGQTTSQSLTVTNAGGQSYTSLKVSRSGAAAFTLSADTCAGTALGKKKTCTVTVMFSPTAAGPQAATVTVTGVKSSPTSTLWLTGRGRTGPNRAPVAN